ncbi:MAG: radical SAM protein, partial [Myxococcales bacterium]|nr:radical SAM protein [Myxococcales bacterium]
MAELIDRVAAYRDTTGTYQHLLANTVQLNGERVKYPELFNHAYKAATGTQASYNVANVPNLGATYLASFLRKRGYGAEIANFFNHDQLRLADLLNEQPALVAITTTYYYDSSPVRRVVDFIRARSPSSTIVVGGPHIFNLCSDFKEDGQDTFFAEMGADIYVFDSQGELTLARLCEQFRSATPDLSAVPNLAYKEAGGTFRRTTRAIEDNDMDHSSIDWDLFPDDFVSPIVQLRTARSCAFKCSFCRYPVVAGALNLTSLEVVERELDQLAMKGTTHLLIIDDTFNIPEKRFKDLCRMMIRNGYNFEWFSYFRCANADDEAFELMAAAGCKGVFLGIESADRSVLRIMNKGATPERYATGLKRLTDLGIMSYASFIVGFPGETEETSRNTINFIREQKPTFYSLENFFYDKKVPIAQRAAEFGLQGNGYSWKHKTMDWRRASQIIEDSYRSIAESSVVPLHGFDIWSIGYLMAHGFPKPQLLDFLQVASKSLIGGLDGKSVDAASSLPELKAVLATPRNTTPRPPIHLVGYEARVQQRSEAAAAAAAA